VGAWVGAVKICGACTAATRVSVSGNLEDLFDGLSESWCVTLRKDCRLNMGIVLFSVFRLLHLKVIGK